MNTHQNEKEDRQAAEKEKHLMALAESRLTAPPGFRQRVMAALPEKRTRKINWWPSDLGWMVPALTGGIVTLLAILLFTFPKDQTPATETTLIQFEIHAPGAAKVELVGDFTAWQPGRIQLEGPDESGHWTTRLQLPEGRYEYLFLVDGQKWVTDSLAPAHRLDGFGNLNAIINI